MNKAELLLPPTTQTTPEQYASVEVPPAEVAERVGCTAVRSAEPGLAAYTQEEIDAGVQKLEAHANPGVVNPENDGRMADIEAAHEAALRENEMFNLYTEALTEDKQRALTTVEQQTDETREEEPEAPNNSAAREPEPAKEEPKAAESRADQAQQTLIQEAQAAMKAAGLSAELSDQTKVIKDPLGKGMLVVSGGNMQLLEPNGMGGYRATKYQNNPLQGTITITTDSGSVLMRQTGEYTAEDTSRSGQEKPASVTLPPLVARAVGYSQVVPVPEPGKS